MPPAKDLNGGLFELVICSLEAWDEVWRRNQFFTHQLLERNANLRVLFVEPPVDPVHSAITGRRPQRPGLRVIRPTRLYGLKPLKVLPRRAGAFVDDILRRQIVLAARRLEMRRPALWLNDVTYAQLIRDVGWPSVYDVTDDWLKATFSRREIDRLQRLESLALEFADEVVVCSRRLQADKGERRTVHLIHNAVDAQYFSQAQPRPADLPDSPVVVYVGTLHESRLDVELVAELARAEPTTNIALVGPDALSSASRAVLARFESVRILGARPHQTVAGYMQHADVLIVPHVITAFTDSLDPIKSYEYAAVARPTVSTAVAGFRDSPASFRIATRSEFPNAVQAALASGERPVPVIGPTWAGQAAAFERILLKASSRFVS